MHPLSQITHSKTWPFALLQGSATGFEGSQVEFPGKNISRRKDSLVNHTTTIKTLVGNSSSPRSLSSRIPVNVKNKKRVLLAKGIQKKKSLMEEGKCVICEVKVDYASIKSTAVPLVQSIILNRITLVQMESRTKLSATLLSNVVDEQTQTTVKLLFWVNPDPSVKPVSVQRRWKQPLKQI